MVNKGLKGKKYNRINLSSERVEPRITVACKIPVSIHEKLLKIVDEKDMTQNGLLCKVITTAVRHRWTQLQKEKNESTRDRLLREINEDT